MVYICENNEKSKYDRIKKADELYAQLDQLEELFICRFDSDQVLYEDIQKAKKRLEDIKKIIYEYNYKTLQEYTYEFNRINKEINRFEREA